jgi:hypothetical protein
MYIQISLLFFPPPPLSSLRLRLLLFVYVICSLFKPFGEQAARLRCAEEYIKMYGEMGKQSNTMIFSQNPADMGYLMAQAAVVLETTKV